MNMRSGKPSMPYDFVVDRSSILGNPFVMGRDGDRDEVCEKYKDWFSVARDRAEVYTELKKMKDVYEKLGKLRLFCWCAPKRCHAETIREFIDIWIKSDKEVNDREEVDEIN